MGHKMNDIPDLPSRPVGRPRDGVESRSVERKIRLEPYLDHRLALACQCLGITKSEAIRQGIQLFLKEAERLMQEGY